MLRPRQRVQSQTQAGQNEVLGKAKTCCGFSFKWVDGNMLVADQIEKQLKKHRVLVISDTRCLQQGKILLAFMDLITHDVVDVVISIFSKQYLESCGYEIKNIMSSKLGNTCFPCDQRNAAENPDILDPKGTGKTKRTGAMQC
eukprot:c3152_g2_i1.p1 GENE.c3152_g2_i1~~c3152_g2_i1.p1  ORF type:complete len:143 (-),score=19.41 c3152_g2_i1:263-691(-)